MSSMLARVLHVFGKLFKQMFHWVLSDAEQKGVSGLSKVMHSVPICGSLYGMPI